MPINTVKKVIDFPIPSQDDIQARDGKIPNIFLQCDSKIVVSVYLKFIEDRIILVNSLVKRPCKRFVHVNNSIQGFEIIHIHRPTAKAYSIAHKMQTQIIKSSKFLCLKPLPLPVGPTHIPPMHISKPSYSHSLWP
jgi:hypothetical protein